jgi:general secretion pathway protein G
METRESASVVGSRAVRHPHGGEAGYTLIEMMTTVTLLAILAALALPFYNGYLEKARIKRTIAEIYMFAKAIDLFEFDVGVLPTTLEQAGVMAGVRDPWGIPYQYSAIASSSNGNSGGGSGGGGDCPGKSGESQFKSGGECPGHSGESNSGGGKGNSGGGGQGSNGSSSGPQRSYNGQSPVNLDYDLFSMGPDRKTALPLEGSPGEDDIIRLDDGCFVGMAKDWAGGSKCSSGTASGSGSGSGGSGGGAGGGGKGSGK